eukprot:m.13170 g.13170  ORF g.13170 m.13170 type:complete len:155 (-) comp8322_c0_seq1:37-501(-)
MSTVALQRQRRGSIFFKKRRSKPLLFKQSSSELFDLSSPDSHFQKLPQSSTSPEKADNKVSICLTYDELVVEWQGSVLSRIPFKALYKSSLRHGVLQGKKVSIMAIIWRVEDKEDSNLQLDVFTGSQVPKFFDLVEQNGMTHMMHELNDKPSEE